MWFLAIILRGKRGRGAQSFILLLHPISVWLSRRASRRPAGAAAPQGRPTVVAEGRERWGEEVEGQHRWGGAPLTSSPPLLLLLGHRSWRAGFGCVAGRPAGCPRWPTAGWQRCGRGLAAALAAEPGRRCRYRAAPWQSRGAATSLPGQRRRLTRLGLCWGRGQR